MPLKELNLVVERTISAQQSILNYTLSFGLFFAAFMLRFALDSALPPGFPFLTFLPVIVIATYYLGTRPGIVCAALSFFAAWYFFLPPAHSFTLNGSTLLALCFFLSTITLIVFVIDRMVTATEALKMAKSHALNLARQRDELFIELQHRVGNNLAMVSAMLKVQARALPQDAARAALESASGRIAIIADINRMFHNPSHSMNRMDAGFLESLAQKCLQANGAETRVVASAIAQPIDLPQEIFLPVALIIAESINNAIEHGFGNERRGNINIDARPGASQYTIEISDNGAGLPAGFDLANPTSIGLKLVNSFVRQINGSFEITTGLQTMSRLSFPLELPKTT